MWTGKFPWIASSETDFDDCFQFREVKTNLLHPCPWACIHCRWLPTCALSAVIHQIILKTSRSNTGVLTLRRQIQGNIHNQSSLWAYVDRPGTNEAQHIASTLIEWRSEGADWQGIFSCQDNFRLHMSRCGIRRSWMRPIFHLINAARNSQK